MISEVRTSETIQGPTLFTVNTAITPIARRDLFSLKPGLNDLFSNDDDERRRRPKLPPGAQTDTRYSKTSKMRGKKITTRTNKVTTFPRWPTRAQHPAISDGFVDLCRYDALIGRRDADNLPIGRLQGYGQYYQNAPVNLFALWPFH